MPTNQSCTWGGGNPSACSNADSPTATTSVSAHAKTVAATKVPFGHTSLELSRRCDQAKLRCSNIASSVWSLRQTTVASPSGASLWENGDGYKANDTRSQFTAVPGGSQTPQPRLLNGLQTSPPDKGSAVGRRRAASGDAPLTLEPHLLVCRQDLFVRGQSTLLQTDKLMLEAGDCSSLPSVPPLSLTLSGRQGAALGNDATWLDRARLVMRSTSRETTTTTTTSRRRCHSAKLPTKCSETPNGCRRITEPNIQLLIRGCPAAVMSATANRKPRAVVSLDVSNKQAPESPYTTGSNASTCRGIGPLEVRSCSNGRVPTTALGASVSATRELQPPSPDVAPDVVSSPARTLVGSVTTQISAIQLTKQCQPVSTSCPSSSSSSSSSPTEETQLSGPESLMQVDGAEEELPDELENVCSDDDDSDCSSINGTSSTTSIVGVEEPMSLEAEDVPEERPALVPSLFPLIPPTLYFSTAREKVELLPAEQRRLLKWKMSTVTPNVVKNTIARSHFKVTKKSHDWLGCWGHHMKSPGFKALEEHQKLNHFPGTFQIGRKDRLWRNLSKMRSRFGKQEFSFFPRTFILPQDIKHLRKAWDDGGSRQKWIIKPPASARGTGIQVIHKWSQLPRKRPLLVQRYLHKPYLISGNKFDLRIYVYVTSYDPLKIYIFTDGLVRFASCKYSSSMKTLGNKFMHLTNYSVNKKNSEYQTNSDDKACQGHKWALKALWMYLNLRGINTTLIWEKIKDIVVKTIIASEPYVNSLLKMHVRTPYSCHELFGFDIMLDENLKPWILEVNISPSLHSNTALDVTIKGQMIRDLLNLAGFRIPQTDDVVTPCSSSSSSPSSSTSSLCGGSRERSKPDLSADEKVKRVFYLTQRYADQDFLSSVLEVLTPDDVRVLAESEDEMTRRGKFERVFPSPSSSRYLRFFESPRYRNVLMDQWEQKYCSNRTKGISLLQTLCQKGVHLGTSDPAHIWSKCSYISRFEPHGQEIVSRSRVVVSLHHRSRHHAGAADRDDDDDDDVSDREVASVSSLPVSPSPGSSVSSSACASPQPGLTQSLLPQHFASL